MRALLLWLISLYQCYLSPYKGFCCAYRQHTGRASCSALGKRVIRRYGSVGGLRLLRQRLQRCHLVYRQHHPARVRPPLAQRGDCDLPCTDIFDVGTCGCDALDFNRRPKDKQKPASKSQRQGGFIDCGDVACCGLDMWHIKRSAYEDRLYEKHYGAKRQRKKR